MRLNNFFKFIIAIAASQLAGVIGSVFTASAIPTWYVGLAKPAWNPPNWVFGPIWITLYVLMGVSAWLIWKNDWEKKEVRMALGAFWVQLFLNAAWSIIFFGFQSPGWALVEIAFLWLAIVWIIAAFYKISKPAAYLLAPYFLWVSFASYLNYTIWMLN